MIGRPNTPQPARGNGPAPATDASELWVKLTQLPRPVSAEHTLRARNEDVGAVVFWVLTAQELSSVRVEASKATKKLLGEDAPKGNLAYEEEYEEQKALHLLSLACRQPDDPRFPAFPKGELVRAQLTDDEITVALTAYAQFRRESGPIIAELTPDEMEAWIKLLVEGGSRFPLARCSGEVLIDLIMYLVSKLPTSATDTSSAGSPLDDSSTPTHDDAAAEPLAT